MTESAGGSHFDAVVIGGGPVGAAAALELHAAGFGVLLIEARAAATPASDERPLALSYGSRLILERLGIWDALAPATAIARIHVSQRGRFGRAVLSATEASLPALGYVVDYAGLVSVLDGKCQDTRVPSLRGARVTSIAHGETSARLEYETPHGASECYASVVVIADGDAAATGTDVRVTDYGQSAVTARVDTDRHHAHTAYERFTPEGPLALLPYHRSYAVVWTTTPERAQWLCGAPPDVFLSALRERFGERVGRFTSVGARASHRVALRTAEHTTAGRAVLIGNAAQALHPVAGQGFNLGLRDAWELAQELRRRGVDDRRLTEEYRLRRRVDRAGAIAFTHALVEIFSNDWPPLALARGAALTLLDCVPPAKDFVVRRMVFGARG
jgi:2-octaprenyl-6-methoxyphenol hydroxylase